MKKWFSVLCIILLFLTAFPALAQETADAPAWRAYNGKRLGVLTGTLMEDIAYTNFPDSEYLLLNSYPDCIAALLANKIDAYLGDEPSLKTIHAEQPEIDYIHERITNQEYSFAFRKNDPQSAALCAELNAFLALCHEDGTMQELDDIWFGVDEERKVVDMSGLTGEKGAIRVVTTSTDMPFSYIKDGKNVGYDIDLVVRFCRYAGYRLELGDVDFAARIPAIQSGKYDFTTDMNVTEERKEQVLFSDPTSTGGVVLAILTDGGMAEVPNDQAAQKKQPVTSLAMLAQPGINIAVGLDTPAEGALAREYPEAKIVPYTDIVLAYMDVVNGRMDACVNARTEMEFAIQNGFAGVRLLDENFLSTKIAVGVSPVSPIPDLKGKLNAFIAEVKADGTLDDMYDRWVIRGEDAMPDIPPAENPSLTLRVGTTGSVMPYSYYVGTELAGYDIELAHRFASWLGAELEIKAYSFGGIIPAAEAGSIDCIMSNLFYSDEKDEAIPFSDVLFEVEITAMVRDEAQGEPRVPDTGFTSLSQLDGARIGVQTGTSFDQAVFDQLPNAEVSYFTSKADLISALLTFKIDAYTVDEPVIKAQMQQDHRLTYIPEYMESFDFAYVFPKTDAGQALCGQFSEYLRAIRADGTMAEIEAKWFSEDDSQKTIADYSSFPAHNGILRMATEALYEPFTYILNNKIAGYDIDIAVRFCQTYGYGLEIVDMSFDAVLPAVQSGKCDFGGAGITITKERRESVLFSEPNFSGGTVMAVLKAAGADPGAAADTQREASFWDGLASSFHKTFLRENRWKLFLEGVGTTMLITLLSILFGTALGFLVFMLCRNGKPAANGVTRFSVWLVTGTPMVVLLMILYYIIFGSVAISGITVAVIGFTLTFGAAVFGLLKMSVGTIDRGQYEAAYALGHSNRHTFFKIILPQAIPHVLPAYQGEIVGLIKATAIVGYIAVQDLTKMGDIVRSRTYEAFFPLIAVTVIYFVLEGLFGFAVSRIRISIDPKKRKRDRILKGDEPPTTGGGRNVVGGEISRNEQCPHEADLRRLRPRESTIKIEHLKKEYSNVTPLKDVSVEIHDGDVISIIGPSGTGKSTLLRCINQLEKPTSGKVWMDDVEITDKKCDINKVRQKMGMVFQSFNLFGHLTVIENIMLSPMDLLGKSKREAYDEGMRLLRTVGLAEKALNYPDELSGGQKQRIAIARTLAMDPDIILLDEPTSALDPTMVGEVQAVIRDLAKTGKTMMIVTHEMNFARAISNRIFYMDEGGIYEEGTPEQIFEHPQRENTRRFIKKLKVLELNIESRDYDFLGMAGEIEAYCNKNQISPKTASRIQLTFEETAQILVSLLESPRIQAVCEYSEATETAEWTICYSGERLDVISIGDELALAVLKGITEEMKFSRNENAELPNQLSLKIQQA